jgi:hypothetical protein
MKALVSPAQAPPARRRRRTPRSPRFCAFPPRRYAAATVSAVAGRPGKASGGHRKDTRGMSVIGLSMAALPRCTEGTWKRECSPRVDWPVYPRRAEHNTVAEGGNRRWAETACRPVGLVELADDPENVVRDVQQASLKQGNSALFPCRPWPKPAVASLSGAKFDRRPFRLAESRRGRAAPGPGRPTAPIPRRSAPRDAPGRNGRQSAPYRGLQHPRWSALLT